MKVAVCRSTSDLLALRVEWNALVDRDPAATIFQTWEWNYAWWAAYCRSSLKARINAELHVVAVRRDGLLVGLFPLWRSRRRKAIRFLGEHVTDYLMPIVDQNEGEQVLESLSDHLRALAPPNSADFIDIPSTHPFALMHGDRARAGSVCPRIALPESGEELLQGISSNLRHSIRKGDRELIQSGRGDYADANEADWSDALDCFEALYTSRAQVKGLRGVLTDPHRKRFWRLFLSLAVPLGLVRLKLLALDGSPACGILCFALRGTTSYYAQGMDPRFATSAPGNLTLWRAVEDAITEGSHTFDFLRGEEEFKMRWRPSLRHNVDITLP